MGCNCNNKNTSCKDSHELCFESSDKCLQKNNYLSEFKTEKEKEYVRENLGINNPEKIAIISTNETVKIKETIVKNEEGENVRTFDLSVKDNNSSSGNNSGNNSGSGSDNNDDVPSMVVKGYNIVKITNENFDQYFKYKEISSSATGRVMLGYDDEYALMLDDEHDGYIITREAASMIYRNIKHESGDGTHFYNGRIHKIIPKEGSKLSKNGSKIMIGGYVPFGSNPDTGEIAFKGESSILGEKYNRFDMSYDMFAIAKFRYDGDWDCMTWETYSDENGIKYTNHLTHQSLGYQKYNSESEDGVSPFEHILFEPIEPNRIMHNERVTNPGASVNGRPEIAGNLTDESFNIACGNHHGCGVEFFLYDDKWYFV